MGKAGTMLALVYDRKESPWESSRGFELREVPRPTIDEKGNRGDEFNVIVRVLYAGVCGSDRSIWDRTSFREMILGSLDEEGKDVRIIGHEMVGEIVEMGSSAAEAFGLTKGQIVSTESHIICNKCYQCRIGETHVCTDDRIIGISRDGCFAEYIKLPGRELWPTDPSKIELRVAACQEPFGNAVHACQKVDMRGRTVAISGCGPIGLFSILVSRALGAARVFAIEPNPENQNMARACGADHVIEVNLEKKREKPYEADGDIVREIHELTDGLGVDIGLEMAGVNSSLNNTIQSVRRGGDVVLFGLRGGDFTMENYAKVVMNGISLHSVIGRRIFNTWYLTKSLLESASNTIQERILRVILKNGEGTIMPLASFDPDLFEQAMVRHPKILLKIGDRSL